MVSTLFLFFMNNHKIIMMWSNVWKLEKKNDSARKIKTYHFRNFMTKIRWGTRLISMPLTLNSYQIFLLLDSWIRSFPRHFVSDIVLLWRRIDDFFLVQMLFSFWFDDVALNLFKFCWCSVCNRIFWYFLCFTLNKKV